MPITEKSGRYRRRRICRRGPSCCGQIGHRRLRSKPERWLVGWLRWRPSQSPYSAPTETLPSSARLHPCVYRYGAHVSALGRPFPKQSCRIRTVAMRPASASAVGGSRSPHRQVARVRVAESSGLPRPPIVYDPFTVSQ